MMAIVLRGLGLLLCLGAFAGAHPEQDAGVAAAARWVEARGCASGSYRSNAAPVVTEVEEAWQFGADAIGAAPVHWDGRVYLVARAAKKWQLLAFDLRTGTELARTRLKGFETGAGLFVWDHMVILQTAPEQISGYVLDRRNRFKIKWVFRGRRSGGEWAHPSLPMVHDNEVYFFLGNRLARIRPGSTFPSWISADMGKYHSRPTLRGPHVFVATMDAIGFEADAPGDDQIHGKEIVNLGLGVFRRSDGAPVRSTLDRRDKWAVCQALLGTTDPTLSVTVRTDYICIGTSWRLLRAGGFASHVMVPSAIVKRPLRVGEIRLPSFNRPPAHTRLGMVVVMGDPGQRRWCFYRDDKIWPLALEVHQPHLFKDRIPPTVLGDVLYCGSWAMDLESRDVLWRLPFADIDYAVVPADGLFLVVQGGKTLRAFRGRRRP